MKTAIKHQLNTLFATALIASAGSVYANETVKWDELSASYESYDNDSFTRSGISFAGTKLLDSNVFVQGRYSVLSGEETFSSLTIDQDLDWLTAGLGYRGNVAEGTDLFGVLSYERLAFKESGEGFGSEENNSKGYSLEFGVRSLITERLELSGSIKRFDIEDTTENGYTLGARYAISEPFWLGISYLSFDDADRLNISAIWHY